MTSYSDYENLLFNYNFIGGAGKSQIPNSSSDARTDVSQDINGVLLSRIAA